MASWGDAGGVLYVHDALPVVFLDRITITPTILIIIPDHHIKVHSNTNTNTNTGRA
jgi:hypothetical protein